MRFVDTNVRRALRITILALAALTVIVGTGAWLLRSKGQRSSSFRTALVERGNLIATISASGTVEPQLVVDIGAQVAGIISSFGKDKNGKTVDYGSIVDENTVLAKIDDSLYSATVASTKAQLQQAEANKVSAEANVLQMKANLLKAENDWGRAQKLGPSDALSQTSYDQYRATYEVSKANLAAAEAAVQQTKAAVAQAKANLTTAQINLAYCIIKSPVKGVIIDRRVNIGQTVVSSLSAPSLFLIANDLKHIQVWASMNEADIGSIYPGQPVTFTVDAYPDLVFHGEVGKIRLNATMSQNVVTYTVEVNTDNKDGKLLPYLTANAKFNTGHRENVLLVPNAALRWSPRPGQIAPETRQKLHDHADSAGRTHGGGPNVAGTQHTHGTLWVEHGKFVSTISVNIGLTDGAFTEVEGKDLTEGLHVIVGEGTQESTASTVADRSPLMPQPFGRGGMRQGQGGTEGNPLGAPAVSR